MKVRDFVVSYDRRKLGQITKVIGDNGELVIKKKDGTENYGSDRRISPIFPESRRSARLS